MWLTSRQIVGRQERINYCPLAVSFPALEFSIAVPGERSTAIFNFMHPFASASHHHRAEGQLLSFDCPLEFQANRRSGKTTTDVPSNCRELIAEILTDILYLLLIHVAKILCDFDVNWPLKEITGENNEFA